MQPQPEPIIIDITQPAQSELTGLFDVLIGALGVAGVVTLVAVILGTILGMLMYWRRSRES